MQIEVTLLLCPLTALAQNVLKNFLVGMETTLGTKVLASVILDRDYRSPAESVLIETKCREFSHFAKVHARKEIENFLLVPQSIDRAAEQKVRKQNEYTKENITYQACALDLLNDFAEQKRTYITSQFIASRQRFERENKTGLYDETITEAELERLNQAWEKQQHRLDLLPGKDALSYVNGKLQERFQVSLTPLAIIDAMRISEVPQEMKDLVEELQSFASTSVASA